MGSGEASGYRAEVWREPAGQRPRPSLRTLQAIELALGIPFAVGAAILRYRLYDIDRLINRTLVYGLLTILLGGLYAATVLVLGQLAGRVGADAELGGRGRHPGRGGLVPTGPASHPAGRRPPLQPAPLRRRQDRRGLQHPPPRRDRPGQPRCRAAGRGRPDDPADPGVTVAPATTPGTHAAATTLAFQPARPAPIRESINSPRPPPGWLG
jgi:hypothetical protein